MLTRSRSVEVTTSSPTSRTTSRVGSIATSRSPHSSQQSSVQKRIDPLTRRNLPGQPRAGYGWRRRCPSTWWAPPPSKRLSWAIPMRRVRFPSTSANACAADDDDNIRLSRRTSRRDPEQFDRAGDAWCGGRSGVGREQGRRKSNGDLRNTVTSPSTEGGVFDPVGDGLDLYGGSEAVFVAQPLDVAAV